MLYRHLGLKKKYFARKKNSLSHFLLCNIFLLWTPYYFWSYTISECCRTDSSYCIILLLVRCKSTLMTQNSISYSLETILEEFVSKLVGTSSLTEKKRNLVKSKDLKKQTNVSGIVCWARKSSCLVKKQRNRR